MNSFPKHDNSYIPPQAVDYERHLIGSCMNVPGAIDIISAKVMTEDFFSSANAQIYKIIVEMYSSNEPVDVITVKSKAERIKKFELVSIIVEVSECFCAIENIDHYIEKIISKAKLRSLVKISESVRGMSDGSDDDEKVIDKVSLDLQNIICSRGGSKVLSAREMILETVDDMYSRNNGKVMGYRSGIKALDDIIGEFAKGDLIVLAGRPSMGKTAAAVSMMLNQSSAGIKVGFLSLEMKTKAIGYRMISAYTSLNLFKVMHGMTARHDLETLQKGISFVSELPFWIDDTPNISPMKMRAVARQMIMMYGIQILYVDHLSKMDVGEEEYYGLTKATKLIAAGAKDMDIPIVLLHQLKRADEKKKEHRPTLQQLRGSGAIEQDADIVIFVHREEYYTHKDEDRGKAELIVAKQRNGPTETAQCSFVAQCARFEDSTQEENF